LCDTYRVSGIYELEGYEAGGPLGGGGMGEVYRAVAREIIVWDAELARCCAAGGGMTRHP